ncbi:hypothetical protein [Nocardioides sp.]|uniref:hypothetical protein n=1 Tax=Nocardioides sp. TaxID=35761 RepID=UPI002612ABAB|nr:hypothetical protein [Nocardioides sp.]
MVDETSPTGSRMTGFTLVTREAEWDDFERARMVELGEFEATVCDGCGFPPEIADDAEFFWGFGTRVCPVCASQEQYGRMLGEADADEAKKRGEDAPAKDPRPEDGRTVQIKGLTREEADAAKAPTPGRHRHRKRR